MPINISNRQFECLCATCGNSQFRHDETDQSANKIFTCAQCKREYVKAELIELNSEVINNNLEEVKDELVYEIQKKFKKLFK